MDIRLNYTASKTPIAAPYSRREWLSRYPAWELNRIFFISGVDNLDILKRMHELVCESEEDGLSPAEFVRRCLVMLDEQSKHIPQKVEDQITHTNSIKRLYDPERLRLIQRTHEQLASGYERFCTAFKRLQLLAYPGWRFVRQAGAKTKRENHVKHEGAVRLKTDWQFWLARNDPSFGGFGNPYAPFGFNSWMRTFPVSREECEKLGLLKSGEKLEIPDILYKWGLPRVNPQSISTSF